MEAIAHLRQGLALLETLPETPERLQSEVDMLIALGASLIATKGSGALEAGETYTRARQLCQHLEDPSQLFPVLRGLHMYYHVRAELQTAHTLGEQLLTLAQQAQDSVMLVAAHRALGVTLYQLGAVASAHTHLAWGIALYDSQQHRAAAFLYGEDSGVVCHSYAALSLWILGYPEQGLTQSQQVVTLAQQIAHSFSLASALGLSVIFYSFCREARWTQERSEAVISLPRNRDFCSGRRVLLSCAAGHWHIRDRRRKVPSRCTRACKPFAPQEQSYGDRIG